MCTEIRASRPTKAAISTFLGLLGVVVFVSLTKGSGLIDAALGRRAVGLTLGVMIVAIGNLIPKMRPLDSNGADSARLSAAERFAGWTLVFAGLAFIALFALAPIAEASFLSSIIGIATLVSISLNWAWQARRALLHRNDAGESAELSAEAAEKCKLSIWLLFGFVYVLVAACGKFLLPDTQWANQFGTWIVLAFGIMYAVLHASLESRRSAK